MKWEDGLVYGSVVHEFTLDKVADFVCFLSRHWDLAPDQTAVIGYDTRFQSDLAAKRAAEALAAKGIRVLFSKETAPWGAVFQAMSSRGAQAAILVTAGGRGVEFNGLRCIHGSGSRLQKADWEAWQQAGSKYGKSEWADFAEAEAKGRIQIISIMDEYIAFLRENIAVEKIKSSGLTVLFDSLYGAGQGIITRLFHSEREHIQEIHQTRHSMFGGLVPAPRGAALNELQRLLHSLPKHAAIAWDAEGMGWSWINRFSGHVMPGSQLRSILESYINRQQKKIDPHLFLQDGILQSLLFVEMLEEGNE